jgi:hypothetical protein
MRREENLENEWNEEGIVLDDRIFVKKGDHFHSSVLEVGRRFRSIKKDCIGY